MGRQSPPAVDILGCRVSRLDLQGALRFLEQLLSSGAKHQVVCVTVNTIISARRDHRLRSLCNAASLALPDGLPVVWASRLLGEAIPGRVAGPDFLLAVSAASALRGHTFYLMGGGEGIAAKLAERLKRENAKLKVAGTCSPPFHAEFPPELNAQIIERINRVKPDILWVGLGSPKQDRWIAENLERLAVKVAVGIGAAFDMYGGTAGRAPRWMQRLGLEWFFRFLKEPRRLFRRYFIEAPAFIPLVVRQAIRRYCFPA